MRGKHVTRLPELLKQARRLREGLGRIVVTAADEEHASQTLAAECQQGQVLIARHGSKRSQELPPHFVEPLESGERKRKAVYRRAVVRPQTLRLENGVRDSIALQGVLVPAERGKRYPLGDERSSGVVEHAEPVERRSRSPREGEPLRGKAGGRAAPGLVELDHREPGLVAFTLPAERSVSLLEMPTGLFELAGPDGGLSRQGMRLYEQRPEGHEGFGVGRRRLPARVLCSEALERGVRQPKKAARSFGKAPTRLVQSVEQEIASRGVREIQSFEKALESSWRTTLSREERLGLVRAPLRGLERAGR